MDFSPVSRKELCSDSGDCDIDSSHCSSRAKASRSTNNSTKGRPCRTWTGLVFGWELGCVNVAVIAFLFVSLFVLFFTLRRTWRASRVTWTVGPRSLNLHWSAQDIFGQLPNTAAFPIMLTVPHTFSQHRTHANAHTSSHCNDLHFLPNLPNFHWVRN